jgi:hypothetical protein
LAIEELGFLREGFSIGITFCDATKETAQLALYDDSGRMFETTFKVPPGPR